ncbi:MAG: tyrosine-type recombinase/integrase [Chloroflexi bacterium]|nr:tyrosine-type recombinase/integrase [Gammaproteobacteria bacterium]MXZ46382.1 tyrosine-type recombinase/integrase [Chloroflexota bacterium]
MANRKRLNFQFVKNVAHSGRDGADKHFDEHGLILRVRASGSKHWIWRGTVRGRRRDLGLGTFPYVSLGEARDKAFEYRRLAKAGEDPAAVHTPAGTAEVQPKSNAPTFRKTAAAVIDLHRPTWRNPKSAAQWEASLRDYAYPVLGDMRVDEIGSGDILRALRPIWNSKRETAHRVRQRISTVMKSAIAAGHRPDNPAGDALTAALPKGGRKQRHQRALPHGEVGAALETVRRSNARTSTKLAFEFLVLTAARSGEVRMMTWDEVHAKDGLWTVPASRMKAGREHRVPLSNRAVEILAEAEELRENELVFPSARGRRMSDNTISKLLRDLGIDAVPHGFRSSFRDWCGEGGQSRELAEAALAHTIRNKAEAAYARTDLLERRRELMETWSGYLAGADRERRPAK